MVSAGRFGRAKRKTLLHLAGTSVMPTLIGGNTHAATVMIGERAADLIRGRVQAPVQRESERQNGRQAATA